MTKNRPKNPKIARILRKIGEKARDSRRRSMLEFASQEIRIPRGIFKGRRYDPVRKPASKLWFDEVDSGRWRIHNYTGPVQSGKTLDAFLIPMLYCLFEKEEDTIVGVPDMNLSMSKWKKDILPV